MNKCADILGERHQMGIHAITCPWCLKDQSHHINQQRPYSHPRETVCKKCGKEFMIFSQTIFVTTAIMPCIKE